MGKVKSLTISLDCLGDSDVPVYSSGATVSGRVQVEAAEEIRVKSLKIHARGRAEVRWTESTTTGSDNNSSTDETYHKEVEYFSHKIILVGRKRDFVTGKKTHSHMGKVKSLTITLDCLGDSTVPVYSSGGTVSGRVQVEVAEEIGVKSLEIHARGRAKVRWSKSRRAGGDLASRRTYYREVEHFSHKAILMGHNTDFATEKRKKKKPDSHMGKVKTLRISLDCLGDSNVPVYSSGATVSGRVQVEVAEEIGVKSLEIHARGRAEVRWSESRRAGSSSPSRRTYYKEVEYFNHKDVLVGHRRGRKNPSTSRKEQVFIGDLGFSSSTFSYSRFYRLCYWKKPDINMGKVKNMTISLDCLGDSTVPVYSSGGTVSGRVKVEVTEQIRVKSLKIHTRGRAKVRWSETTRDGNGKSTTRIYYRKVEYFNQMAILIGHTRDGDNSKEGLDVIHAGWHEYRFSFQLPQAPLPSSFEGRHGNVRYWVKAELNRSWHLPVTFKKEFTVFEHIDINIPSLLTPQTGTKEKTVCCCCCASGPISLSAKIERQGYISGESIQIFAEIENWSSRVVVPKAAICQTQKFHATTKTRTVKEVIAVLQGDSLPPGKTETWNGQLLKIPPVSPSLADCIVTVEYSLKVYVDISGATNLSLHLPLVIGTVPLRPTWPQNLQWEPPMYH